MRNFDRDRESVTVVMVAPGLHAYALGLAEAVRGTMNRLVIVSDADDSLLSSADPQLKVVRLFRFLSAARNRGWLRKTRLGKVANLWLMVAGVVRTTILCRRERPLVVHLHGVLALEPIAILAMVLLRATGQRIVFTPHNVAARHRTPGRRLAWQTLLNLAGHVIVHSEAAAARLSKTYGVNKEQITVVPFVSYGVLTQSGATLSQKRAREALRVPSAAKVLLFLGRIEPYKGLSLLISAFRDVLKAHPSAVLVVAGRAPNGFDQYQSQISAAGIERATIVRIGWLDDQLFGAALVSADVVALPYRDFVEIDQSAIAASAMAFGKPVVATRVGGLSEQIIDGDTGLLASPDNPADLARQVNRLFADPELSRRMGDRGRSISRSEKQLLLVARRTLDIYRRVGGRGTH